MQIKFVYYLCCIGTSLVHSLSNPVRTSITRLETGTLGDLYQNIEQDHVDTVSISNDLTQIYYHIDNVDDVNSVYTQSTLRLIQTNPLVTYRVLDMADKKHIDTTFISKPVDPISTILGTTFQIAQTLAAPILLYAIIRTLFFGGGSQGRRGGTNPFSFGAGSPFGPVGRENEKENMIKANISLSSWAGSPEVFEECVEIVSYLKNATVYENAGAEIPKGILLEGPPGTGKTLLAKAIASEADANFISVSASEFIELYVGLGASKVRSLFKQARENKPAIIFIDEIDAVGKQRGSGLPNMGGNDEREQTLNQILAEMDGFTNNEGVLVIAATNRRDILDAALLRPGRFDRLVNVPLPDRTSRRAILDVHAKNKQMSTDINLDLLAEATSGFSGAQLKNLLNEGAIYAARAGNASLNQENLENALEKLVVGIVRKTDIRSEEARRRVAIHEIGHAFLATLYPHYFDMKKVTIQSTYQGAGGYTLFNEKPDISESGLYTKDLLKARLIVTMGGKAAETLYYGEDLVSVGAVQDLKQANNLARRMIGNYGMGQDVQTIFDESMDMGRGFGDTFSDRTKQRIDEEALDLVKEAFHEAVTMLNNHRDRLDNLVDQLLKKTTLSSNDFYPTLP
jgi:cell division protease FtsH